MYRRYILLRYVGRLIDFMPQSCINVRLGNSCKSDSVFLNSVCCRLHIFARVMLIVCIDEGCAARTSFDWQSRHIFICHERVCFGTVFTADIVNFSTKTKCGCNRQKCFPFRVFRKKNTE